MTILCGVLGETDLLWVSEGPWPFSEGSEDYYLALMVVVSVAFLSRSPPFIDLLQAVAIGI